MPSFEVNFLNIRRGVHDTGLGWTMDQPKDVSKFMDSLLPDAIQQEVSIPGQPIAFRGKPVVGND